ncbi:hypothetical protein MIR68_009240 [Amoeboaphelidium protococcarum]|nr:hypothetical protein MIR68_009240 [Amoeboaphelidium protococcarum]
MVKLVYIVSVIASVAYSMSIAKRGVDAAAGKCSTVPPGLFSNPNIANIACSNNDGKVQFQILCNTNYNADEKLCNAMGQTLIGVGDAISEVIDLKAPISATVVIGDICKTLGACSGKTLAAGKPDTAFVLQSPKGSLKTDINYPQSLARQVLSASDMQSAGASTSDIRIFLDTKNAKWYLGEGAIAKDQVDLKSAVAEVMSNGLGIWSAFTNDKRRGFYVNDDGTINPPTNPVPEDVTQVLVPQTAGTGKFTPPSLFDQSIKVQKGSQPAQSLVSYYQKMKNWLQGNPDPAGYEAAKQAYALVNGGSKATFTTSDGSQIALYNPNPYDNVLSLNFFDPNTYKNSLMTNNLAAGKALDKTVNPYDSKLLKVFKTLGFTLTAKGETIAKGGNDQSTKN